MTVSEITAILEEAGIEEARHEAMLIMSEYSGKSVANLRADPKFDFTSAEMERTIAKRKERYPLQYLFGKWEFCGLTFTVNENCLIPRPDTEVIVERAIKEFPRGGKILDLCTGTGCIIGAVLKLSGNNSGVAVELYHETAEVARKNLTDLGLTDVSVIEGDATTDLFTADTKFDVITANPPYVTADEMAELESELMHEPSHALTDGGDGMSILTKIIEIYKHHLTPDGTMILEHGWQQGEKVRKVAENAGMTYEAIFDYGGCCRGAVLKNN
ncbi:MAG: peptide chain release factor N(5)-glutamine methyltransferase [Clostridia bacterium]|nr:peptide chain release factor N(5)-glutamine methyltransferase [Clostridia bacterium]